MEVKPIEFLDEELNIIMQMMEEKSKDRPTLDHILERVRPPNLTMMESFVFQPPGKGMELFAE